MTSTVKTQDSITGQIDGLWGEFLNVWHNGFMGVGISNILISLLVFAVFLVLRGVLSKYILQAVQRWTKKSNTDVDDKIIEALILARRLFLRFGVLRLAHCLRGLGYLVRLLPLARRICSKTLLAVLQ